MDKKKLRQLGYHVHLSPGSSNNSYYIMKPNKKILLFAQYDSNNIIQKITHWEGNDKGGAWLPIDPNIELTDTETIVALYLK